MASSEGGGVESNNNTKLRSLFSVHVDGTWDGMDARSRRWLGAIEREARRFDESHGEGGLMVVCVQGAWGLRAGCVATPCLALGRTSLLSRLCPTVRVPCTARRAGCAYACGLMCAFGLGCACSGCVHDLKDALRGGDLLPYMSAAPDRADMEGGRRPCSAASAGDSGLCVLSNVPPEETRFVLFDRVMSRHEDAAHKGALVCRWGDVVVVNAHLSRDEEGRKAQLDRVREMVPKLGKMYPGCAVHMCLSAKFGRAEPPMQAFVDRMKTDHNIRPALAPTQTTTDGRECDHILTSLHSKQEDAATVMLEGDTRHVMLCARFSP